MDADVLEILYRLGLALTLSLLIAVLLAWAWSHSDTLPPPDNSGQSVATTSPSTEP